MGIAQSVRVSERRTRERKVSSHGFAESLQERSMENFLLQGGLSECADSYFGIRSTPVLLAK